MRNGWVREEFFQRRGAEVCIVGATRTEVSERLMKLVKVELAEWMMNSVTVTAASKESGP